MNNSTTISDGLVTNTLSLDEVDKFVIFFKLLIYLVGVVGNLLVLFVIWILKEYSKPTHWYVLQLAIADLLFLQMIPFKVSETLHFGWIYHDRVCQMMQTLLFLNYYASILFLTIMAIDRYIAVCHPMGIRIQRLRTRQKSYIIAAVTWIVALLLCIPVILYSTKVGIKPTCQCTFQFPKDPKIWCEKNQTPENETDHCINVLFPRYHVSSCSAFNKTKTSSNSEVEEESEEDYDWFTGSADGFGDLFGEDLVDVGDDAQTKKTLLFLDSIAPECVYGDDRPGWFTFIYFNFFAMFVIPLVVITVCYGLIIYRVRHREVGDRRNSATTNNHSKRDKTRVTIACGILVVLFAICWLPFHIIHLAKIGGISGGKTLCNGLSTAISIFAYLNSAFNPYIYNFIGSKFKDKIRTIVTTRSVTTSFYSATGQTRTTDNHRQQHQSVS